jgi:hypothetical protein
MPRVWILALAVVLAVLVVAQFVLPAILEGQVEDRLTRSGGTASVELSAIPSPRLLFREGDRLKVRAEGIVTPLIAPGSNRLGDLDGFGEVDVRVVGSRTGPFKVSTLTIRRSGGDGNYRVTVRATVTGGDLSAYAGGQLAGGLGGFLAGLAGGAMPGSDEKVPIELDAVLRSDNGTARAVTVDGTVGGLPAGPIIEALATALAGRF